MELLAEMGYQFNKDALRKEYDAAGMKLTKNTCNWYEAASPYIVMAYEQGKKGRELSDILPFLEVMKE